MKIVRLRFFGPPLRVSERVRVSNTTITTFTIGFAFSTNQSEDVKIVFNPATTTEKAVEITIPFTWETRGNVSSAVVTVGETGSTTVFKIGEKYTTSFGDYRLNGEEWTVAEPLSTTYASKLTPVDEEKKDGAKDPITVTCTNGMIKKALIEGDNTTQILVLTDADAKETKLSQVENKINFTITDGQCVVSYVFNDAPIKKDTVGKAQLNLGTTAFLEGALTFDGSKSVASIVAALLAVLALVF
ncbi:hypothetical protein BLNAU_11683 [Blattamonas nauphoetae]|uniref:Uncharacterized protein n=1 Tax=Blattamonas nauphoetae TaxID=2049346 RepID=A0ABQ9XRJ5_9EUKA|nr:hypothetical protein BLNAU_11683 [Blattamonas nauphoetae]